MREIQDDGSPLREHLESLVRMGRREAAELEGPPVPDEIAYLRRWYLELWRTRDVGEYGPKALTYEEVQAWAAMTGRHPLPHEVEALFALDSAMRHPDPDED